MIRGPLSAHTTGCFVGFATACRVFIALLGLCAVVLFGAPGAGAAPESTPQAAAGAEAEQPRRIGSGDCGGCHEESRHGTPIADDLSLSSHRDLECLSCHQDKDTAPHAEGTGFTPGADACGGCHGDAAAQYQVHGRLAVGTNPDIPRCQDCHGDHDILPSNVKRSRTHPANLPATCGACHQNLDLTRKYEILLKRPVAIYQDSVHGKAAQGGVEAAATCNDCHSSGGTAHRILSPGNPESAVNHFNIPHACGRCHKSVAEDYWQGIHGKLVARGEADAPVCTHCHGEHGIISPDDPRSPVSRVRVAEATCAPCHESAVLNEKYGLAPGRLATFIDSYHGLKSKAGDLHVANCASCHGAHRILPSTDPTSTIFPANLRTTCGKCHPGISVGLASIAIHGVRGEGLRTPFADLVEKIYIIAIVVIVGLMALHWLLDLGRQMHDVMVGRPRVLRMQAQEVWQHAFLTLSFITLVISGFALRFSESWVTRLFFGWEQGFALRGVVHRVAAVVFTVTVAWHLVFVVVSRRGRRFVWDMLPVREDFAHFGRRVLYNLGLRPTAPRSRRFSYVEKAEYWALVWGTVVMIVTGVLLWFDNWFIRYLPKGVLDVILVVHYWEAWLATLAILVWHLYATVFNPHVYPMNPSWLTGSMPERMYRHEHPEHLEEARQETDAYLRREMEKYSPGGGEPE